MEKIYRVQLNSKGAPNFSTAKEVEHGEWLEKEHVSPIDGINPIEEWQSARCSVCGKYHTTPYMYYFYDFDFCPSCGADMRKEKK